MKMTTTLSLSVVGLMATTACASGSPTTIYADTADYEIRQDTNTFVTSAQDGATSVLDVIGDASFDGQEVRSIFQFDLSSLGTGLASIDSATMYITLESVDVFPSSSADMWASQDNRTGSMLATDPAATGENGLASYALVKNDFAPIANPTLTDVEYSFDLTSFISDRYADYQATPSESWVYMRAQVSSLLGTSFYNFYSGDEATAAFRPRLEIDATVPTPASALLLGLGGLAVRRRR